MHNVDWDITQDMIEDKCVSGMFAEMWKAGRAMMVQRTAGFSIFGDIAHNRPLFGDQKGKQYSEGSTQAIKRKIRAQTIQRVPDGTIDTQYDKNSIEQAEIEFIFKNKVLTSEYDRKDMMKNLWRTFNSSYDYGFGCVRTGFEKDLDGDVRITYSLVPWNDIVPAPDCDFIEEAEWYIVREYISKSDLRSLLTEEGEVTDPTYNADTVKFILQEGLKDGVDPNSAPIADKEKGASKSESVEVRTLYKRGEDTFVTFVPSVNAVLRTVKNEDPRKDVPLHFLILEPDPEFPLGCSMVMWTLGQQQFADAFQTIAYQTLQLAAEPPLMLFGNLTPAKIKMKPRSAWPMGTNPNNKVEKFPVETTTITQYGSIIENVAGNMMKNLNVQDGTIASDANVMNYSGTPQGVEAQRADKTITINQFQKRVEIFFAEWANHALRSYINSMSGKVEMTVDEKTRRRIFDIQSAMAKMDPEYEPDEIIDGDKITVDFDKLSADMLEFNVRAGSLIQNEKDQERKGIQELLVPVSQMLNAVSDDGKQAFEKIIMQLIQRLCELSDVDISQSTSADIGEVLMAQAMQATMEQVMGQQQQIDQIQQQLGMAPQAPAQPEQPMPPEGQQPPMPPEGQQLPPAPQEDIPMPPPEPLQEPIQ